MKRAAKIVIGAVVVCLVATVVVVQTGFGQGGPNPECPQLRTDALGFPLEPPFSEYPTGGGGPTNSDPIDVLKVNLPCCAVVSGTTITFVDADCFLEVCIPPAVQVFPGQTCPVLCTVNLTIDAEGAVRNCSAPFLGGPPVHGGGSNFILLTGTNAN